MEPLSAVFMVFGMVLLAISWLLLLQLAFARDYSWGMFALLLPPLAYFYGLFRWDTAREPILMSVLGWVFIFIALA